MCFKCFFYLIIASTTSFSFTSPNYIFWGYDFSDLKMSEISKDTAAPYVADSKIFSECVKFDHVKSDTNSHFYFVDINNDKIDEIVYMGGICAEGVYSVFWKNDNSGYKQSIILNGKITGINFYGKDTTYISTFAPGCCASDCDYANLYRITKDTNELIKEVTIFYTVELPTLNLIKKKIILQNTMYSLRSSPKIENKPDSTDYERYGVLRGNVIAELPKGITVNVTSMTKDTTGRTWWFSIVENYPEMKYGVYGKSDNICGWISTKMLEYEEKKE